MISLSPCQRGSPALLSAVIIDLPRHDGYISVTLVRVASRLCGICKDSHAEETFAFYVCATQDGLIVLGLLSYVVQHEADRAVAGHGAKSNLCFGAFRQTHTHVHTNKCMCVCTPINTKVVML